MKGGYTDEELKIAKRVDLVKVAEQLGYTPVKVGNFYSLKEMDSIRIYHRSHWYRFSNGTGGSQIDFVKEFLHLSIRDSVFWLLDFAGYYRSHEEEKQYGRICSVNSLRNTEQMEELKAELVLPEKNPDNTRLKRYLMDMRGLSEEVVDYFLSKQVLYETKQYHNLCFLGKDKEGNVRYASLRGTYERKNRKPLKMDVRGSNKEYGFHIHHNGSVSVVVTEGAIDAMSYVVLTGNYEADVLALGMINDKPLEVYLSDYPGIQTIQLALDNDEPGRRATKQLISKYLEKGYTVTEFPIPKEYKDLNEWVQDRVRSLQPVYFKSR